jgi:hypothetical protein
MHFSRRWIHFMKHSRYSNAGVVERTAWVALARWLTFWKLLPSICLFTIGISQKSLGARSGEYGGCLRRVNPAFLIASLTAAVRCGGALSWWKKKWRPGKCVNTSWQTTSMHLLLYHAPVTVWPFGRTIYLMRPRAEKKNTNILLVLFNDVRGIWGRSAPNGCHTLFDSFVWTW